MHVALMFANIAWNETVGLGMRSRHTKHGRKSEGKNSGLRSAVAPSPPRTRMTKLAKAFTPKKLAEVSYSLYERFRPQTPEGVKGWGANGDLDLGLVEELAKRNA